jgi:hypothetical protein
MRAPPLIRTSSCPWIQGVHACKRPCFTGACAERGREQRHLDRVWDVPVGAHKVWKLERSTVGLELEGSAPGNDRCEECTTAKTIPHVVPPLSFRCRALCVICQRCLRLPLWCGDEVTQVVHRLPRILLRVRHGRIRPRAEAAEAGPDCLWHGVRGECLIAQGLRMHRRRTVATWTCQSPSLILGEPLPACVPRLTACTGLNSSQSMCAVSLALQCNRRSLKSSP